MDAACFFWFLSDRLVRSAERLGLGGRPRYDVTEEDVILQNPNGNSIHPICLYKKKGNVRSFF